MRQDEQGPSIRAAEQHLDRTFRHIDLPDLLSIRRIDQHLAIGDIDISIARHRQTFTAAIGEQLQVGDAAIIPHQPAIDAAFRFIADISAASRLGRDKTICVQIGGEAPSGAVRRPLLEGAAEGRNTLPSGETYSRLLAAPMSWANISLKVV